MDPNQQSYQPPTGDAYDFIMNPQKPPKPKKLGLGNNSNFGLTIGLIVGGAVIFMIIVAIILSLLSGGSNTTNLLSIAQTQNELVRVADQGARSGVRQTTKNLAVTIQYGMTTQQKQTLAYMTRTGTGTDEKSLKLKQNATTDQQLASAKTTSTFDSTFAELMQTQLTAYANSLRQLHGASTSETEKELLSTFYEQTQLLISQIPYTQDSIDSGE
jgi:hypothetical protein